MIKFVGEGRKYEFTVEGATRQLKHMLQVGSIHTINNHQLELAVIDSEYGNPVVNRYQIFGDIHEIGNLKSAVGI